MKEAAKNLDFERAAEIRDLIKELKNGKGRIYGNHSFGQESFKTKFKKEG